MDNRTSNPFAYIECTEMLDGHDYAVYWDGGNDSVGNFSKSQARMWASCMNEAYAAGKRDAAEPKAAPAEFEAWATANGYHLEHSSIPGRLYSSSDTNSACLGWLAARISRAAAPPSGELTEAERLLQAWSAEIPPNGHLYWRHVNLARGYFMRRAAVTKSAVPPINMNDRTMADAHGDPRISGRVADPECEKCGGAGWLRGSELDGPDTDTAADTMTKYSCDGEKCVDARLAAETNEARGRQLYERYKANAGIHENRMPAWGELPESERDNWIETAVSETESEK